MDRAPRLSFPGIVSSTWEHPRDKAALSVLRGIPGLQQVQSALSGLVNDRALRLMFLGSCLRTSPEQFPRVHDTLVEACRILDLAVPELYLTNDPNLNAMAIGINKPFIVLNAGLVNLMTDDGLLFVIGHELGHIKAGHSLFHTLLWLLVNLSFDLLPLDKMIKMPIILALRDWERQAEHSADRAGLLCVQDPETAYQTFVQSMSGGQPAQASVTEMFRQADEYEKGDGLIDSLYKLLNLLDSSHPMMVTRAKELKHWVESGAYQKILDGQYRRQGEEATPEENFKEAYQTWKDDLDKSQDPAAKLARQMVDSAEKAAGELGKLFGNLLNR